MKKITFLIVSILLFTTCDKKQSDNKQTLTCSFTTPTNNTKIYNNVEINLTVTTSRSVKKVEFYLDGILIGTVITEPYSIKWTPLNIDAGNHKLSCIAIPLEGEDATNEISVLVELKLGDSFKGGKIFFIDETLKHGLIASTTDITLNNNSTFFWGSHNLIGASDINSGKNNTTKMATASFSSDYAGYAFKNGYESNGFNDWYIPAQEQLKLLKENQDYVGGFSTQSSNASYWSSTELSFDKAFALNFAALMGTSVTKGVFSYRIRPIRDF